MPWMRSANTVGGVVAGWRSRALRDVIPGDLTVPAELADQPFYAPWRYGHWSRELRDDRQEKKELPPANE